MISSRRRSKESARTPPGSANSISGRVVAACTNETSTAALGASTSSHWAPTVCIQVPVQLNSMPTQSQRKARWASGAHGDESPAAGRETDVPEPSGSSGPPSPPSPPCVMSPPASQ